MAAHKTGRPTAELVQATYGVAATQLDREFDAWLGKKYSHFDRDFRPDLKALRQQPGPLGQALTDLQAGKRDAALQAVRQLTAEPRTDPALCPARFVALRLAAEAKDVAEAAKQARLLVATTGCDGYVPRLLLAEQAKLANQPAEAVAHLRAAQAFDPADGTVLKELLALAAKAGLPQLELREHDLLRDPLPRDSFDLAWMRWVAMFLGDLEPLLTQLPLVLRPDGRLVVHEYVHWDTFGLHPHGRAIARFGQAVQRSFREAGGDPDVNRRLPSRLAAQGFQIEALTPLPVLGGEGSMAAQWLQRFVAVYAAQLMAQGLWSADDQAEADAEMAASASDPGSYWVGPTVLELRATR